MRGEKGEKSAGGSWVCLCVRWGGEGGVARSPSGSLLTGGTASGPRGSSTRPYRMGMRGPPEASMAAAEHIWMRSLHETPGFLSCSGRSNSTAPSSPASFGWASSLG